MHLSPEQLVLADQIAADTWHRELALELGAEFPAFDQVAIDGWCALCRATCSRLEVTSQHGIYAFHILCLRAGSLISSDAQYVEQHQRYKMKYGSADSLPIDLLAWVRSCGG